MMSTVSNTLSSLVMSLPLIAVPCLAVFGLPSIGPATAEADAEESIDLDSSDTLGAATSSLGDDALAKKAFAPIIEAKPAEGEQVAETTQPVGADRSQIATTSEHRGASANRALGLENEVTGIPSEPPAVDSKTAPSEPPADLRKSPQDPNPFAAVTEENVSPSDWESVLGRLRKLGIQKFHITDGEVPGEFYFCCSISSAPNVTQRFEAEGESPTAAAIDVLAQVEQCQGIR